MAGADRVGGDDRAFDQEMRVVSSSGMSLQVPGRTVGVDDEVLLASLSCGMNDHLVPVGNPAPPDRGVRTP